MASGFLECARTPLAAEASGVSEVGETSFEIIETEKDEFPVSMMCRVLGVSRAGYYAWRERGPSERAKQNIELAAEIGALRGALLVPPARGSRTIHGWRRGSRYSRMCEGGDVVLVLPKLECEIGLAEICEGTELLNEHARDLRALSFEVASDYYTCWTCQKFCV